MQDHRPIAFHSQVLKGKALHLSTYEKELLALVTVVHRWRPYLLGRPFIIKTDQQSLKYILEQRIATPAHKNGWLSSWVTCLLWSIKRGVIIRLLMPFLGRWMLMMGVMVTKVLIQLLYA